ncbi:MAG: Nif3-like dinuclear metal center hexameric protein [Flavobacteriales bacterium]
MLLKDIVEALEELAPARLQESYDNSGLLVGNPQQQISGALVCLDCTEAILDEAIAKGCNLVVAHHPIIFSGLKRLTGKNYIERTVIKAIQNEVAIYAIHTNLDNVQHGVNAKIAEKLGLNALKVLSPKADQLLKLEVFVPVASAEAIRMAVFQAGGGHIGNYDECSFATQGDGTFRPIKGANPTLGELGTRHTEKELNLSFIVPVWLKNSVHAAMKGAHPYEEVAHQWIALQNNHQEVGSGMIGELAEAMEISKFLSFVKEKMKVKVIRHTHPIGRAVKRVAVCGGSGSFLLTDAIGAGADVFITADFKYHQFFDADGRIVIADIGHFESEQFTIELLGDWFKQKFPTFASHLTAIDTNPVHYL